MAKRLARSEWNESCTAWRRPVPTERGIGHLAKVVFQKTGEIPSFAMVQFDHCSNDLAAVSQNWPTRKIRDFRFDPLRTAFDTEYSASTLATLFGNRLFRGGKIAAQLVRTRDFRGLIHSRPPCRAETELPRDAVILLLHKGKTGVVMASAEAGLVAKLRYGEDGKREWEQEIEASNEISATEAGAHVPPIVASGIEPGGCAWIVMRLAPNDHPILPNLFRGDRRFLSKRWRQFLRHQILPVLECVCTEAGIDEIAADDYLQQSVNGGASDPTLQGLLQKIEAAYSRPAARTPVLISRIHGDLYARHVHRSGGRWWLLDWGESARRELFLEILNQHIRRPASYSCESRRFWNWLAKGGELAGEFGAYANLFCQWIHDWTGHTISPEALRFQLLVHLLKRVQEERETEPALLNAELRSNQAPPDVSHAESILADLEVRPAS